MPSLPEELVAYHARGGRTEGAVNAVSLRWFQLWPLEEIQSINEQYHVAEFAPGLLAFGSDGGGEMLALNAKGQIVLVPFVGMELRYATLIAASWRDFEHILSA